MSTQIDKIHRAVSCVFPEEINNLKNGKTINSKKLQEIHTFILGFAVSCEMYDIPVSPYVTINLQCGRADRLLPKGE